MRSSNRPSSWREASRLLLIAAIVAGCSGGVSQPKSIQIGHHQVRLQPPAGWEHLDHGREQLFRNGETELRLEDLGPATRKGLVSELRQARALWLAGRRGDALARINTLHGPPISFLPQQARADFWKPWTDVTYLPDADSASLGRAFAAVMREAEALPETPEQNLVEFVLRQAHDAERREIDRLDSLRVHGSRWLAIETWDRLSHTNRRRVAVLDNDGHLLYLVTERGRYERMSGAFDSLLASIEVTPGR